MPSGASGARSRACAPRTRAGRAGASWTGRSRPTTRWASTMPGGGPTRTSSSASTPCSARTSAGRTGSTARGSGWRSTSSSDLGFTSKRDIEEHGIAEFVSLCKQRVLDLRRPPDRAVDPARVLDGLERPGRAPPPPRPAGRRPDAGHDPAGSEWSRDRHRRDARRAPRDARAGRLVLHLQQREQRPDLGLHRRVPSPGLALQGPRHDALVRPLRHRDQPARDDRGLRGSDRPRPDGALPAGRPAGRVAARLDHDALDAHQQRGRRRGAGPALRQGSPGRGRELAGPGNPPPGPRRARSRSSRRSPAASSSGGATGARSTTCPRSGRRSPPAGRTGARTSIASSPGTRSARRRGPGSSTSRPGAAPRTSPSARQLGLPMLAPLDEGGIFIDGFGFLVGRDVRDSADPVVEHLKHHGFFHRLEPYVHRYPHCWRCGTPLVFRLVDEWFISMGPVYDRPREELTPAEVDASLRYQIMEVVDRIRWIPGFGYERELDWLLNMHDWMISKKRYWGLALPIYDCAACGTFDVVGGREELRERAVAGWEELEGHTPHRPHVDAVRIACPGCGAPVERIPDVGNPWLDAGIVPFSTLHYREDPAHWADWFPADFITESFPGQFRNWFYSMLAMSTVLRREAPFKADLRVRDPVRRGRPPHAQELGQRDRVRRGRRADGRGRDALDVRQRAAPGQHPLRLACGGRGAARAARPVERLQLLRHLRPTGRLAAHRPGAAGGGAPDARPLDPLAPGRPGRAGRGSPRRLRPRCGCRLPSRASSTSSPPGTCAGPAAASRGRATAPDRAAAFATLHAVLAGLVRVTAPLLPVPLRGDPPEPGGAGRDGGAGQRPPDPLADGGARRVPGRGPRGRHGDSPARRRAGPHAPGAGRHPHAPAARPALDRPARRRPARARRAAGPGRGRGQRARGRADRRRVRARGAPRQAAPPEDRQEAGPRHPGGHGRGPRRPVRDPAPTAPWPWAASSSRPTRWRSSPRPGPARRWPTTTGSWS